MAYAIHMIGTRKRLAARREPYWAPPLDRGLFLGVRKLDDGTCTWIARMRDDDGRQKYRALGQATDAFDYTAAKKAAEAWHKDAVRGVALEGPSTVADACKAYVEALRAGTANSRAEERDKAAREAVADEADARFARYVYGDDKGEVQPHSIARVRLDRLRTAQLKQWRADLGGTPANQNRYWTSLRAALNLAVENKMVTAAARVEWQAIKQHKVKARRVGLDEEAGGRRLYLTLDQRCALIEASTGGLRDLLELAALTGARPGELAKAKRSAFDQRAGTLRFKGKTGGRTVQLAPAAITLCKRLAQSKLPDAPLVMQDDGKPWVRWDWDQLIRDAARRAKLPSGVVLYTLRHSWISDACRNGMPLLEVARLTGTSLEMIQSNYGHVIDDAALRSRLAALPLPLA